MNKEKINRPYTYCSTYRDWYIPYGRGYRCEGETILNIYLNKPHEIKSLISFCKDEKLVELIKDCIKKCTIDEDKLRAKQTIVSSVNEMYNDMVIRGII